MAAFLAHYRSLSEAADSRNAAHPLSADEREVLTAMRSVLETLTAEERALLNAYAADGGVNRETSEQSRRRQRAETKLRRILTEREILRG
jgi:predicted transcriptional regulator